MTTPWQAGAARIPFPIPIGTALAGYAARVGSAATTHDELQIAALVLAHGERRLTLVTADIIAIDSGLVGEVANAAGIDANTLILAASHTHSGPAGIVERLHPAREDDLDSTLRAAFIIACAEAIARASDRLQPATLRLGRADAPGVGANRNTEDGPRNDRVTTLAIRTERGGTVAVLVHFACHPTVLGAESRAVSADLMGGLRRAIAPEFPGDDPVILVGNGAAGDISTRYTRRSQDFAEIERLSGLLAAGATRAMASAIPLDGPIRRVTRDVPLPRKADPGPDAVIAAVNARADAERILASDVPHATKRRALTWAQGAELAATLAGATGIPATATLSAWTLGAFAMVAVPGELFASLGQRIEHGSPFAATVVLGYANGHVGYLVGAAAARDGTYEALASPYLAAAGDAVAREAIRMLHDLHTSMTG